MLILAYRLLEVSTLADATFIPLENKVWFENSANAWGNYWILYHKTNKEASTVLCSVVKYLGSGRALKKQGKNTRQFVSCFPLHYFPVLPHPACFKKEQSTVEASLLITEYMLCLFITGLDVYSTV